MKEQDRKIQYKGDLFELTSTIIYSEKSNKIRVFEKAHRPPGVRMLFSQKNKILLSREYRRELKVWDYRLPGGKVFDDFHSYLQSSLDDQEFNQKLKEAVQRESIEEVGLIVDEKNINFLHKSVAGSSVKWDLYYYEITKNKISESGQELEEGEQIEEPIWVEEEEVVKMCLSGEINEDRSVAVLLRYILNKEKNV